MLKLLIQYLHSLLVRQHVVGHRWFSYAVGRGVELGSWGRLPVKVQLGHQWVAAESNPGQKWSKSARRSGSCLVRVAGHGAFTCLLGVGEPGMLLDPVSAACGLKELVLTVGMALLTRRPHVAMLMFI